MKFPEEIAVARARWKPNAADFDAMMVEYQLERERQEFFDAHPTREGRLRAIAGRIEAERQGVD